MSTSSKRRLCIPVVYVRGTYYDVGYNIGRTFKTMIESFLEKSKFLCDELLPMYETSVGKMAFEKSLEATKKHYPQYINEMQGTADGANVPFHLLYLLHTDLLLPCVIARSNTTPSEFNRQDKGCTDIMVNVEGQEMMGHNEDTVKDYLHHMYFVSAHIIEKKPQGILGTTEEKFTSLCYAGFLPGYCMGYNHHGVVTTINTIDVKNLVLGRIPRHILCRALLAARDINEVQNILTDEGVGIAEGVAVNVGLLNEKKFWNIEAGPNELKNRSLVDIIEVPKGKPYVHTNMLLRLKIEENVNEVDVASSIGRHKTYETLPAPVDYDKLIHVLSDQSQPTYNFYRDGNGEDYVMTICTGIFNFADKSWAIYADNPEKTEPVAILPLTYN